MKRSSVRVPQSMVLVICMIAASAIAQVAAERGGRAPTTRPTTRPATTAAALVVPDLRPLLSTPRNEMLPVSQRYEADRASLTRSYFVALSPTRRARMKLFYKDWLEALERVDSSKFTTEANAEHAKLKDAVTAEARKLDEEAAAEAQILPLIPFAQVIVDLGESRRRLESMDPQKAAGTLAALKRQIAKSKDVLTVKPADGAKTVDKALATRAADAVDRLRGGLRAWFGFYNDYDPLFTWWATQAYKDVDQALADYITTLREKPLVMPPNDNGDATVAGGARGPVELTLKLAGKEPQVPDLNELLNTPQSEMRNVIQAYAGARGGRFGGGGGGGGGRGRGGQGGPGRGPELIRPRDGDPNATANQTAEDRTRRDEADDAQPDRRGPATAPTTQPTLPRQYLQNWLAALQKIDFDALPRDAQVDYILLRNRIESDLRRAQLRDNPPTLPPRRTDDSGISGRPIGRDALEAELAAEMIPYSPDQLIAIAEKEFQWCEKELKQAARDMGLGDDWRAAIEKVKNMYVPPGKQPDAIRDLAWEAVEYLEKHDLVTVPTVARESWRMGMMTPERQLVNPFFTGGETISVSYPTSGMPYDAKLQSMRGNNIPFSRATVHHELIPGHHLQGFMNQRYATHRRPFSTSFWGEGWALYWEMILYKRGFPATPEQKVGMLFWRSHRCARIVFSLGFHTGKMTPRECIDYLVDRVGHERDNATAEVRRSFAGNYAPLYQAAYMLGGLQFRSLHEALVDSGQMTDKAFHDAILKQGSMPVGMVRAIVANEKLTRDYKPNWKFYGEIP